MPAVRIRYTISQSPGLTVMHMISEDHTVPSFLSMPSSSQKHRTALIWTETFITMEIDMTISPLKYNFSSEFAMNPFRKYSLSGFLLQEKKGNLKTDMLIVTFFSKKCHFGAL
jgi:hypothetical protein